MLDSRRRLPNVDTFLGNETGAAALLDYMEGLFTRTGGVMYARSVSDGRHLLVNHGFEELVGRPAAQIVGRTSHELFSAEAADSHRAHDELVLRNGRASTFAETAIDAGGATRHYVSHKFPMVDGNGAIFAIGGLSVDVTHLEDRRRADELARLEAESQFRTVFEHAPIGQVFSGVDGRVTAVNAPLAAMLGYRPEEIVGRPALEFVPPDDHAGARAEADTLRSGRAASVSTVRHFRHRDGHLVLVRVVTALLPGPDGGPGWWASMVVDLSAEERAREALEQAHAAAIASADRLHLLHSIATAANEARTLDELAPQVLRSVCGRFGWAQAALVQWRDGMRPLCRQVYGTGELGAGIPGLQPPGGDGPEMTLCSGVPAVVVPVSGDAVGRHALLFAVGPDDWGERQREALGLVGSECSRVLEREVADRRLRETEARFRSVFDASPLAMGLTVGDTGTYSEVNEALCQLVGRSRTELIGASARQFIHPDDAALADPAGAAAAASPDGRHSVELRLVHSSGATVIADVSLAWMDGPNGTRLLLAQMEDITARRTAEQALRDQAERDSLTGLANRTHLARALTEMSSAPDSGAGDCAVVFIDLDGFKLINDTRGHDVGDEVLVEVAARLRAAVRPADLVARFGGDEFVIVFGSGGSAESAYGMARRVAARIETAIAVPIETSSGTARITASIGISGGLAVPGAPQELLLRADTAMYRAKRLGKDRRAVYDADLHEQTVTYQRTAATLRNALAENRFVVHYQPIVRLHSARLVGFEALVRLRDGTGELVPPGMFIAVAEQSGLIVPMGTWVLRESCRTIARLRAECGRPLVISVNVAAQQAQRSDLAATVSSALAAAALPADALTLELTESALLDADVATMTQLAELRDRGVQIALDDFGTGYSSLAYLRRLPVSSVKVDQSFVRGMTDDGGDAAIVSAVTGLAGRLGLSWVAEGVETHEQRAALSALGDGFAQGYLFGRPAPADTLVRDYVVPRPV